MVVDELFVKKGSEFLPIDSLDNQMIDEIVYEGESYHFAKQKDLTGTSKIEADNGVDEPIISLGVAGATFQQTYTGKNLATAQQVFNKTKLIEKGGRTCVESRGYYGFVLPEGFKEKTQYTISLDVITERNPSNTNTGAPITLVVKYKGLETSWNNNQHTIIAGYPSSGNTLSEFKRVTLTTLKNQTVTSIGAYYATDQWFMYVDVNTFQVEQGTTATEYEPYVGGMPSPNPGKVIKQYKDEEVYTDISSQLADVNFYTDEWKMTGVFDYVITPADLTKPVTFHLANVPTGDSSDRIIIASSPETVLTGSGTYEFLADGFSVYDVTIDLADYPNGIYIGAGNTSFGMTDDLDKYKQWVIDSIIHISQVLTVETNPIVIPAFPQDIQNANDNGTSVVLHGTNLATAYQVYGNASDYTELEFEGRNCIRFIDNKSYRYVIDGGFKENTQYTISCEVSRRVRPDHTAGYSSHWLYVKYTDGTGSTQVASKSEFTKYSFTTSVGKTVEYIGLISYQYVYYIYIDIDTFQINEGTEVLPYESYFREEINIPTSIDVNGTNVPLLMSAYDKLSVDRLNNKVIYTEGSFKYSYTGNETGSGLILYKENNVNYYRSYVNNYIISKDESAKVSSSKCTHFRSGNWNPLSINNAYSLFPTNIIFRTDGKQTLDEFKALLQEQYTKGTPVTVVFKRDSSWVKNHDLTNTDLGQQLLALATRKGTNYLEITSDLAPSQTDLSYWRQIIPNE